MRTKGSYLYAASGAGGLQVYDIKNPLNPIWAKGLDIEGQSQDLWIEDDRVYVAAGDGGVAIFDILDPFYTQQVGGVDTPGEATRVAAGNEYLYVADSQAGLLVMDARDPQRPVEVGRYDVHIWDMWLNERDLWLVTGAGVERWSLGTDGRAKLAATLPGVFTWVRTQGDLIVTATLSGAVSLWRRTARGFEALGQYVSGDAITGLQLDGNSLYVMGPDAGLQAVDIRQPPAPRLTAVYPATGNHTQLAIARGAAFLAGESKLSSVTLLPPITIESHAQDELTVRVPANLPVGDYHLLAVDPEGRRWMRPNAFKVRFAAPGKGAFSLESFRQLLKSPLKPPVEAETDIPAGNAKTP